MPSPSFCIRIKSWMNSYFPTFPNIHKHPYLLLSVYQSLIEVSVKPWQLVHNPYALHGRSGLEPAFWLFINSDKSFNVSWTLIAPSVWNGRIISQSLIHRAILNDQRSVSSLATPLLLLDEHKNVIHCLNVISRFKLH